MQVCEFAVDANKQEHVSYFFSKKSLPLFQLNWKGGVEKKKEEEKKGEKISLVFFRGWSKGMWWCGAHNMAEVDDDDLEWRFFSGSQVERVEWVGRKGTQEKMMILHIAYRLVLRFILFSLLLLYFLFSVKDCLVWNGKW